MAGTQLRDDPLRQRVGLDNNYLKRRRFNYQRIHDVPAGVLIQVGDNWQSAINAHPNGTIFIAEAGVHNNQSFVPRLYNQFWGQPGAVLNGNDTTAYLINDQMGVNGVELHGLKITGYVPSADSHASVYATKITSGLGWVIEDCEFYENRYAGAYIGENATVRNCYFHHNHRSGLKIVGGGALVEHNEFSYNNYAQLEDPLWDVGGMKAAWPTDAGSSMYRHNWAHNNHGSGLWLDIEQDDVTFEYNLCEDNYTNGIVTEVSDNTTIRYNEVNRNGLVFGALYNYTWGPGIQIQSSSNCNIYENIVVGNYNGITATQYDSRGHSHAGNQVDDNDIRDSEHYAAGADGDASGYSGLDWQGNSYSGNPTDAWRWQGSVMNFASWQALGFDV